MSLLAGVDVGTSALKLVVLDPADPAGRVLARAGAEYPTATAPGGVAEQDPEDWWRAAQAAFAHPDVAPLAADIAAIGLTGQMQDLVPVAGARPVRPALLYSDVRAADHAAGLHAAFPDWDARTGNLQDAAAVPAKIAWLAAHEPAALDRAEHLLFSAPAYVARRAGAASACDVLTASTTGLLDVEARGWDDELAAAAGARPATLPPLTGVTPGDDVVGGVSSTASDALGVAAGTPLVLAMGDAGATTDGLAGSEPGDAYLYLGTTGWVAGVATLDAHARPAPSAMHSLVMPHRRGLLRIGAVLSAGAAAAWSRDTFLPGLSWDQVEALAADRVDRLDARPLCLPGLAGERTPVRDARQRAAFVGASRGTGAVDFHLATLTGVAMGLRHAADAMGVRQRRIPLVGGGAASPAWRRIVADVFAATIVTGAAEDPGCHAAARAAARALDLPVPPPLLGRDAAGTAETHPSGAAAALADLLPAHRALYDALAPSFHSMSDRKALP